MHFVLKRLGPGRYGKLILEVDQCSVDVVRQRRIRVEVQDAVKELVFLW